MSSSTLLKILFTFVIGIILYIFYSIFSAHFEYLDSQKAKKENIAVAIATIEDSNKSLIDSKKLKDKSDNISDVIVFDNKEEQKQTESVLIQTEVKVKERIATVKNDYKQKIDKAPPTQKNDLSKEVEQTISLIRAQMLWENFCKMEPTDFECVSKS